MNYLNRFSTGRKLTKIATLLGIVCVIELFIHFDVVGTFSRISTIDRTKKLHTYNMPPGIGDSGKLVNVLVNNNTGSLFAGALINRNQSIPVKNSNASLDTNTVHVFNPLEERREIEQYVSLERCVRFFSKRKDAKICVYDPKDDVWVSREIVETGAWEMDLLNMTEGFYKSTPNLQLLDIGCNIGVFTLSAAILGKPVVAVDVNKNNLKMLSMSLTLNNLHDKVSLVWNAVSDVYEQVELGMMTGNIGGTYIKTAKNAPLSATIASIKIDDLTPTFRGKPTFIKMDIEGSEWKALNGAWGFFEKADVQYVLMEYVTHIGKESGKQIRNFFAHFGFLPYKAPNYSISLDPTNDANWSGNVLWIKQSKNNI